MRFIITLLLGFTIGVIAKGCHEEEVAVAPERALPEDAEIIRLAPSEEYFYAFEAIPHEGGFLITEAPQHAEVSEFTHRDGKFGYLYQPENGFIGNDLTVLEMCASIGGPDCYDTVLVAKLGFVITENRK
jgi:hypothetical protein